MTALDMSVASLDDVRQRLGQRATLVNWLVADVAHTQLPSNCYDLWHDGAALHILVDPADAVNCVPLRLVPSTVVALLLSDALPLTVPRCAVNYP